MRTGFLTIESLKKLREDIWLFSVFIFKRGIGGIQLQQRDAVLFKTVKNLAGRMLMDGPDHGSADGSAQGMPGLALRSDC